MIDPEAAEAYRAHAPALVGYATTLVGPADAEDVVAEAMVKALTSDAWRAVREPRPYLFRCVLNEARDEARSAGRRAGREQAQAGLLGARPAPDVADQAVESLSLTPMLDALSVRERAVIHLAYWEDLRPAEIADALGCSEGSVRRYLARARAKLRKVLCNA